MITIRGRREVQRSLTQVGQSSKNLPAATADIGQKIRSDAFNIVPKRTGALAGSIKINRAERQVQVVAGSTAVPYAAVIEYGSQVRNIRESAFLRTALEMNSDFIVEKYSDNIQANIQRYMAII